MRYRIDISYRGTRYCGWQKQPNGSTVQEELERALGVLFKEEICTTGCGRTDTGVHASRFTVHFDTSTAKEDTTEIIRSLNALLPDDISVWDMKHANDDFHARYSAKSRSYEYLLHFHKDPFLNGLSTYLPQKPDIGLLNKAAAQIIGERDFKAFSKLHSGVSNHICHITESHWHEEGGQFIYRVTANRFLRNMVRAIVGTCLLYASGKLDDGGLEKLLDSGDRSKAGPSVPAEGLYLRDIIYP